MEEIKIDKNELEKNLSKLEPTQEEFIERRINHKSFAKLIYWLCAQYLRKNDFIYVSELTRYMKYSQPRAYTVLRELCNIGILKRNEKTSNLVEFHFVKNGNTPVVFKYFKKAKKVLDLE